MPDTYDETTNIAATPEMYPDVDLSSDYTVNLYQVGDKPNDYDQVEAAINEYSNNDMAIAAGSKNPERSAMVLDMLKFDTTLNRLMCLGIEGTHYEWNDDNTYSKLDAKTADFAPMAPSVSWAVKNGTLQEAGTPERELAITEPWEERVVMNPTITFVFDDTEIKAEVATVTAVLEDYVPMIELGLVDDVDVAMDEMIQRCNDSGLQTVKDALAEQYEAWAATR